MFAAQQAQHVLRNDRGSTEQDPVRSCFDGGVGTLTCLAKEGSKLYTNSIRTTLVHKAMTLSYSKAYQAALGQGLAAGAAEVEARQAAEASGKHTAQNAQRILGPLFAASLDGLEVLYNGGTLLEVGIRATGTLGGTWLGGVLVRLPYLIPLLDLERVVRSISYQQRISELKCCNTWGHKMVVSSIIPL